MKYEGVEVHIHSFLLSAQDVRKWSGPLLYSPEKVPGEPTPEEVGWHPTAENNFCPSRHRSSIGWTCSPKPVTILTYTDSKFRGNGEEEVGILRSEESTLWVLVSFKLLRWDGDYMVPTKGFLPIISLIQFLNPC